MPILAIAVAAIFENSHFSTFKICLMGITMQKNMVPEKIFFQNQKKIFFENFEKKLNCLILAFSAKYQLIIMRPSLNGRRSMYAPGELGVLLKCKYQTLKFSKKNFSLVLKKKFSLELCFLHGNSHKTNPKR